MALNYFELNQNLTDEQIQMKQAVRKFAQEVVRPIAKELHLVANPEDVIKKESRYWECMRKMYELGYHTVFIPEQYGGTELQPIDMHIFWEELACGSAGFAISLAVTCFPGYIAALLGNQELINVFTKPLVEDKEAKVIGCWAITEPDHGSDVVMCGTDQFRDPAIKHQLRAKFDGDEFVLNGQKSSWVSNGPIATHALLHFNADPTKGMDGGGIALVPLNLPGISKGKSLQKLGQRELPQGEIFFDNVRVPKEYLIAPAGHSEPLVYAILTKANALMAACFTGAARAAYEEALQYAQIRIQGGKPICEHQLIQDKLFKMFMKVEAARAISRAAMVYNYSSSTPRIEHSIAAKVYCTQASVEVADEAIQIFGGNGLTMEYPVEKIYRDARASLIEDGCNEVLGLNAINEVLKYYR